MTKKREKTTEKPKQEKYEKPEVRTEEVFETLAATCSKAEQRLCEVPIGFQGYRS